MDFIRGIEPLNFEPELVNDYLSVFKSDIEKHELIAQVEMFYEDIENKKERLEILDLLNNPHVFF
ncbi:hypothetical protein GCM10028868_36690 [Virgibacillus kimchii]